MSTSLAMLAARWGALAGTGEPTDLAQDMLALALGLTARLLFGVELGAEPPSSRYRWTELFDS